MAAATDMDAVLTSHAELQDLILKECLLTNQDLLKVLTKIMTICLLFAEQVSFLSLPIACFSVSS